MGRRTNYGFEKRQREIRKQKKNEEKAEKKRQADALREREAYLRKENIRLRSNIKDRYRFGDIIGKSPAMQEVYELILKASATDANVLLDCDGLTIAKQPKAFSLKYLSMSA